MPVNILHNGVVCLIEYVGTVTKRAALLQIVVLVDICIHRRYAIFGIFLVEGVQKLFKIAPLLCRVIF